MLLSKGPMQPNFFFFADIEFFGIFESQNQTQFTSILSETDIERNGFMVFCRTIGVISVRTVTKQLELLIITPRHQKVNSQLLWVRRFWRTIILLLSHRTGFEQNWSEISKMEFREQIFTKIWYMWCLRRFFVQKNMFWIESCILVFFKFTKTASESWTMGWCATAYQKGCNRRRQTDGHWTNSDFGHLYTIAPSGQKLDQIWKWDWISGQKLDRILQSDFREMQLFTFSPKI